MYSGSPFNDAPDLVSAVTPDDWPVRVEIDSVQNDGESGIQRIKFTYGNKWSLSHPSTYNLLKKRTNPLHENLGGAKIIKFRVEKRLRWIGLHLDNGTKLTAGSRTVTDDEILDFNVPAGCKGLKGFWGRDTDKIERLGLIWA
ncbi:hypothetical protein BDW02DRAFT_567402 [Decorospora gaudefroyi]|uniref:Jacalin-type lectin domain-containing protein n=1 Tax=Decorospora gaudefroyi TaxID=184978 RepID=A0A6A5KDF9_9PLEO|nr:hypothetical protein BDW02DRAFT_567402 [Decorospora gaudefroyi]